MNALEEFEQILRFGYNSEALHDIKPKLESYLLSCPEEEKAKCQKTIELAERLIAECKEVDKLRQQYNLFHDYVLANNKSGVVELEYIEPCGNSYGVYVKVDNYVMELVFKPMDEPEKNEVRTRFYIDVDGLYKSFMIKKDTIPSTYTHIQQSRRDYYPSSVRWDNWGIVIIDAIKTVVKNPQKFLQMCRSSCPFCNDGTHKYKSWKTKAKVEITYEENNYLEQGVKKYSIPKGNHVVGGNGTFVHFERIKYVLKYTVKCVSIEMPIRYSQIVDVDDYIRELKEKMGWKNLRYEFLNSKLPAEVEVITYDMDKCYYEREFTPIEYNGNWLHLLQEAFNDL